MIAMLLPTQIKFNNHDCTLMLTVPSIEIPEEIARVGKEHGLLQKPEFHISVVVSDNARRVHELVEEFQQFDETLQNLETLASAQDWSFERLGRYSLHEELYTRERLMETGKSDIPPHTRKAIVERVHVPGMDKYFRGLTALLGPNFTIPLTHITLFSWSDFAPLEFRGISLLSEEDYKRTLVHEL
jgi:hypothetical protein